MPLKRSLDPPQPGLPGLGCSQATYPNMDPQRYIQEYRLPGVHMQKAPATLRLPTLHTLKCLLAHSNTYQPHSPCARWVRTDMYTPASLTCE